MRAKELTNAPWKKPGAVSARAFSMTFSDYAFSHESRFKSTDLWAFYPSCREIENNNQKSIGPWLCA